MEYKSTFTIPSARIYMDELSSVEQDMVRLTFLRYNRMKEWYYNQSYTVSCTEESCLIIMSHPCFLLSME